MKTFARFGALLTLAFSLQPSALFAYPAVLFNPTNGTLITPTNLSVGSLTVSGVVTFSSVTLGGVTQTNWPSGGGGSATNALAEGPGGIRDASLITNVQATAIVGTILTNNLPMSQLGGGGTVPSNILTNGQPGVATIAGVNFGGTNNSVLNIAGAPAIGNSDFLQLYADAGEVLHWNPGGFTVDNGWISAAQNYGFYGNGQYLTNPILSLTTLKRFGLVNSNQAALIAQNSANSNTFFGRLNIGQVAGTLPAAQLPAGVVTNTYKLGFVSGSGRLGGTAISGAGFQTVMARTAYVASVPLTNNIICAWANYAEPQDVAPGWAMILDAALEYPSNVYTRISFNGQQFGTNASGATIWCDPITLVSNVPQGAMYWIRTYTTNVGFIYGAHANPNYDQVMYGANVSDLTMTVNSNFGNNNSIDGIGPIAIVAPSNKRSILVFGDSRDFGFNDPYTGASPFYGINNLLEPTYGVCNVSFPGETFTSAEGSPQRLKFQVYADTVITDLGVNSGGDVTAPMANWIANYLTNKAVIVETISPWTTSSDNWSTLANQTKTYSGGDALRIKYNTNLRNGLVPGVAGYLDVAATTESSLNSGYWAVNGTPNWMTADGNHENQWPQTVAAFSTSLAAVPNLSMQGGSILGNLVVSGGQTNLGPIFANGNLSWNGIASGNGSSIGNLNASQITSGTLPTNALPGLLAAVQNGNGAGLTNYAATNLASAYNQITGNLTNFALPLNGGRWLYVMTNCAALTNFIPMGLNSATLAVSNACATATNLYITAAGYAEKSSTNVLSVPAGKMIYIWVDAPPGATNYFD